MKSKLLLLSITIIAASAYVALGEIAILESTPAKGGGLQLEGNYVLTVTETPFKIKTPPGYEKVLWQYPDDAEAFATEGSLHVTKIGKKDSVFEALCIKVDYEAKTTEVISHSITVRNGTKGIDGEDEEDEDDDDSDPTKVVSIVVFSETTETTVNQAKIINRIQSNRNPKYPTRVLDPDDAKKNQKYKAVWDKLPQTSKDKLPIAVYLDDADKIVKTSTLEDLEKELK